MAEQLSPFPQKESEPSKPALHVENPEAAELDNVTYFHFNNPELNREVALREIGKVTMSMAVKDKKPDGSDREFTADYGEILSSEPMQMHEDPETGIVDVDFIQYWQDYRGDNMGTPHVGYTRPNDNNRRLETVRILNMRYDPSAKGKKFVTGYYLPPRIHKHKLLDYWYRLRSEPGKQAIATIRKGLWGPYEE